ncbi:MAG TPA: N(4)-(beta-N-acetylglucosaminyl)-L-asparaginase [Terriglobales bacterium]|nr:N(4)-(beta-N-acetylglucosaminyl)-L-asparaginase [Terriglobales bacterium]
MEVSRRKFLSGAAVSTASLAIAESAIAQPQNGNQSSVQQSQTKELSRPKQPVIITKVTGKASIDQAWQMLKNGQDTLDAVLHVCKAQEDDPTDQSVGLGGLPNEEGVVELDSCCMHGPTRKAGSVGGVRNIKNVCLVARDVMRHTGHVMLCGEGGERFAVSMGYPRENLLTEQSRKMWLLWKETNSTQDWWGPGPDDTRWKTPEQPQATLQRKRERLIEMAAEFGIEPGLRERAAEYILFPPTGTIHVSVVNEKGEMSGATTTSGLSWKLPGRLGDSPIIGAGCYCDQDVGSAGATGSGEENIKVAGGHSIVENMRRGMTPKEAGLEVLQRIVRNYNHDMNRLRYVEMVYYILRRDGQHAGVSLWSDSSSGKPLQFAVHDGTSRLEQTVALLQGNSTSWPATPRPIEEKR